MVFDLRLTAQSRTAQDYVGFVRLNAFCNYDDFVMVFQVLAR